MKWIMNTCKGKFNYHKNLCDFIYIIQIRYQQDGGSEEDECEEYYDPCEPDPYFDHQAYQLQQAQQAQQQNLCQQCFMELLQEYRRQREENEMKPNVWNSLPPPQHNTILPIRIEERYQEKKLPPGIVSKFRLF